MMFSPIGTSIFYDWPSYRDSYINPLENAIERRETVRDEFDRWYLLFLKMARDFFLGTSESRIFKKGKVPTDSEAIRGFQVLYDVFVHRELTYPEKQRFIKQWKKDTRKDLYSGAFTPSTQYLHLLSALPKRKWKGQPGTFDFDRIYEMSLQLTLDFYDGKFGGIGKGVDATADQVFDMFKNIFPELHMECTEEDKTKFYAQWAEDVA